MKNEILNKLERLQGYVKILNSYKNMIQHSRYK